MFHGSMVALVTPMTAAGEIDFLALEKLIDWHCEQGTQAIIIAGTTGESSALNQAEKQQLFKQSVRYAKERLPIIAGTATNATASTIEQTKLAMECGVDACLIMTPAYVKPTQAGLIKHYQDIAAAVSLPIILYNVPSRTACDLLPETAIELANVPNIIGIKEATADLSRVKTILQACPSGMDIYSGDDATACDLILQGGRGVISVTANVAPAAMARMCAAAIEGDENTAKQIDAQLAPLHQQLFCESNPIPVKWALNEMGWIQDGIRLPLTRLSPEFHESVRDALTVIQ